MKFQSSLSFFLLLAAGATSATAPDGRQEDYVISFDRDFEEIETALLLADATVQRQLTCTRGIVASLSEEGRQTLVDNWEGNGIKVLPLEHGSFHGAPAANDEGDEDLSGVTRGLQGGRPGGGGGNSNRPGGNNNKRPGGNDNNNRPGGNNQGGGGGGFPTPGSCSICPASDSSRLSRSNVDFIKTAIKDDLVTDQNSFAGSLSDSIGELLRLVFHDSSAFDVSTGRDDLSGLNGCVDLTFASNAGLHAALTFLENIRSNLPFSISRADMHVLGAMSAVEQAGGPIMPFRYGRIDVDCECEDNFFPNPESPGARLGTEELDTSMRDRLGLSPRDITALLGSHTVGKLEPTNSGYEGGWIPPVERATFDNLYYVVIVNRPWVKLTKVSPLDGSAILTEWRSPLLEIDAMMLNIDAVLGFEIDDDCNVFGDDPLDFMNTGGGTDANGNAIVSPFKPDEIRACTTRTDEYGRATVEFANDNIAFLRAYESAFLKLVDTAFPCGDLSTPR